MRIKHSGQMPMPSNPKHGAGDYHALCAKRALASCASGRQTVHPYAVAVTTKRHRRIEQAMAGRVVTPASV